jgi:arginyl-tRNA synthetase
MIDQIKLPLKEKLEAYYKEKYCMELSIVVETPKKAEMGDVSIPMFTVVKAVRTPMPEIVAEALEEIKSLDLPILNVSNAGAFVNLFVDKAKLSAKIIQNAVSEGEAYGNSTIVNDKTIVLNYSSPNNAKSFSVGHLRCTMIGNSLKLILQKCGYNTVAINYLGDWGTQFGKRIVAIEKWGDIDVIKKDPIIELASLYVRVNNEEKDRPEIAEKAREAFRKIQLGEPKYVEMWKWIREESLKESEQIYDLLGVTFDSYNGEAFYNVKMEPIVNELEEKKILEEDQSALVVRLSDDIPPALIKTSNGGTLYSTRDLAAVFWRKKEYNFAIAFYVVGGEQKLHFQQLKGVLSKMGYQDLSDSIMHVNFGMVLKDGKKMSTRMGNVVKLYDILMQAIDFAKKQIEEKHPNMENKDEIAVKVGCGTVVFNDLKLQKGLHIIGNIMRNLEMELNKKLPNSIKQIIEGLSYTIDSFGEGNSIVVILKDYILKKSTPSFDIENELRVYNTLKDNIPIPKIIECVKENNSIY